MAPDGRRRPFWYLTRSRRRIALDVDEELQSHIDQRVEALVAGGMDRAHARRTALRQFGDIESTRAYCRNQDRRRDVHMRRQLLFQDLGQDLRTSARSLLRAPALTLTIVLTVALGIGATTAIFAAVHAALLRPLPYPDAERLVRIYTDAPPNVFRFSVADYLALAAQQTQFEAVAGYTDRSMAVSDGTVAERVIGRVATAGYLPLLGITPAAGRAFTDADTRPGAPPVVLLSDAFFHQRLGGRADAVGQPLRIDGVDHTIVGVLPPARGPIERRPTLLVAAQWATPSRRGPFFITPVGRLRPGAEAAAAAELRAINKRIFPIWRTSYQNERATWSMMTLDRHVVGDIRTPVMLSIAAVVLVWLIACTNASNLLLARVTSRQRELAVRAALGASRTRVARHLLAESAVLAAIAAALGAGLAYGLVAVLRSAASTYVPRTQEIAFDAPVMVVLGALGALSALMFGAIPALHGSGKRLDAALGAGGRAATASRGVRRSRRLLVSAQFAIATPLLVVAGLLLGSFRQLQQVDLGFDTANLVSGSLILPAAQYNDGGRIHAFWEELARRVAAVPGVTAVTYADSRPPQDAGNHNNFMLEAYPIGPGDSEPVTPWVAVTPEYFGVLGLKLVEGRLFDDRDLPDGRDGNPVVVDRAWARRFFPGGTAVGKRLKSGGCSTCPWTTVVGVVSEMKYEGLRATDAGVVYTPLSRRPDNPIDFLSSRSRYLIVRTASDPSVVLPSLRGVIGEMDPRLPFANVATVEELLDTALTIPRTLSLLAIALGTVALVLSLVGIYGVMTHHVQQHAKEISIRLALGGRPAHVLRLVLGDAMRIVVLGLAAGLAGAVMLGRAVGDLLFNVRPADPVTLIGVALLLGGTALFACVIPARRAVAAEPASVLRGD